MYKIVCKSLRTATFCGSGDYSFYTDLDEAKRACRALNMANPGYWHEPRPVFEERKNWLRRIAEILEEGDRNG